MATPWNKPLSRMVTLPAGAERVVTLQERGVLIRLKRHRKGVFISYEQLERCDPEHATLVETQHWGRLRVSVNSAGVMYEEVPRTRKKRKLVCMLPHGVGFQRALYLLAEAERAAKKEGGKGRSRRK